jgi:hypothetical protein
MDNDHIPGLKLTWILQSAVVQQLSPTTCSTKARCSRGLKKNNLHFIAMRLGKKETNWIRSGHLKVVYKSGNFISICSLPVKHWDIFYRFAAILFFPFCFSGSSPKSCPSCMWRDLCLHKKWENHSWKEVKNDSSNPKPKGQPLQHRLMWTVWQAAWAN